MGVYSLVSVCAIFIFPAVLATENEPKTQIVQTNYGKVEGYLADNELYYEFLGIRYAVPVKFRAPTEPPSHSNVYKANNRSIFCPQFPTADPLTAASENEDCLVLNLFTPAVNQNHSLPVLMFIHGGDFGVGSGSPIFYSPQYLVSLGVVVVSVNYRLNYQGFLNLGIQEAPGNAGLKDIRAALRWIRDNINAFGGDKDNVTIFGQGSGGVAAIYMTLSESTQGLFHKVITESGTPFTPQSFDMQPLKTAKQVAKCLEKNSEDPKELYNVYATSPINKIEEAISKQMYPKSVFLPSVENVFKDEEAFFTDTPFNILKNKQVHAVPMIIGLNTVEGLTSTLEYETITSQIDRIKNQDLSAIDQRSFQPKEEKEEFRRILNETYFSNSSSEEMIVGGIVNLVSDFSYVGPMSLFTEMYVNKTEQPVFQYVFNYFGNRNLGRWLTNSSLPATTNRDELFYIFELERMPLPMDENDARIVTFMTMMWTNFAKFGTPTPDPANGEWLPYPHHLAIMLEPEYVAPLTPERAYFWRALWFKYGSEITEKDSV